MRFKIFFSPLPVRRRRDAPPAPPMFPHIYPPSPHCTPYPLIISPWPAAAAVCCFLLFLLDFFLVYCDQHFLCSYCVASHLAAPPNILIQLQYTYT